MRFELHALIATVSWRGEPSVSQPPIEGNWQVHVLSLLSVLCVIVAIVAPLLLVTFTVIVFDEIAIGVVGIVRLHGVIRSTGLAHLVGRHEFVPSIKGSTGRRGARSVLLIVSEGI